MKEKVKIETFEEKAKKLYPFFKIVGTLGTGKHFGHIALDSKKLRSKTVICSKNTDLLILNKHDYNQILSNLYTYLFNNLKG